MCRCTLETVAFIFPFLEIWDGLMERQGGGNHGELNRIEHEAAHHGEEAT